MFIADFLLVFGSYVYYQWTLYRQEYRAAVMLKEKYHATVSADEPSWWIFAYLRPAPMCLPDKPRLSLEHIGKYGTLYSPITTVFLDHDDYPVDDRAWNLLQDLPFLDFLRIACCEIRVRGGLDFSRFARLEDLDIEDTRVSIHDIETLPRMPKLRNLSLWGAGAVDEWLILISRCTSLEWLWLSGDITDKGVGYIAALKDLRGLGLPKTRISSRACETIAKLSHLEILDLADTVVGDEGMKYLRDLQSLRELMLCGTPITDQGVKSLSSLRHLEALYLDNTRVTRASLPILSTMQSLRPDWVTLGTAVDKEEMERWRESQRKLKSPNGKQKNP